MEESEDDSKSAMVINDQLHQSKITKRSDPNKTESSFISNLVGSVQSQSQRKKVSPGPSSGEFYEPMSKKKEQSSKPISYLQSKDGIDDYHDEFEEDN